jgi:hypothetical protein
MRAPVLVAAALACGCGAASSDPGLTAALQVAGAQFVPGAPPATGDGPAVRALDFADAVVTAGAHDRPLLGKLDPTATAVAIGLDGDRGYWIALAAPPGTDAPTLPTFDLRVAFAARLAVGPRTLVAHAVDARRHFGPATTQSLTVAAAAAPTGPLVVRLGWQGNADLDLHVIAPDGVEIWSGHPSGYQPPPPPALPDPAAAAMAAQLDADSNAGCVIDGRDQENVVWSHPPPSGHYIVRVDAPSLCGDALAAWRVDVVVGGAVTASATGEALGSDTRGDHRQGAGRTALEFDLP